MTCCYLRTAFTTALRSITCSVFYCIGEAVVNGWLLYRKRMGQKDVPAYHHLSLLKFQADIASPHYQSWKSLWGSLRPRGHPSGSPTSANAVPFKKTKGSVSAHSYARCSIQSSWTLFPVSRETIALSSVQKWIFTHKMSNVWSASLLD